VEVFTGTRLDDDLYEELESTLILSDAGVKPTSELLELLKLKIKQQQIKNPHEVKFLLETLLCSWLTVLESSLDLSRHRPTVIMVAGVNGAGKTTTVGKLTHHLVAQGAKVLLAAADTFRAAAKEQLLSWADRNQVDIISQTDGDPAAVSFDAVSAGKARQSDVVLIDTAGRLPTQLHLMDELKKIKRVIQKADPEAPHEVILVLDGHMGQNALSQAKAFDEALGLTGLVLTKLDGTAKGGILLALAHWNQERLSRLLPPIPVYFIGVGEGLDDLQPFVASEFAQALLS
jgi:fused signal recognition particle receptor